MATAAPGRAAEKQRATCGVTIGAILAANKDLKPRWDRQVAGLCRDGARVPPCAEMNLVPFQ